MAKGTSGPSGMEAAKGVPGALMLLCCVFLSEQRQLWVALTLSSGGSLPPSCLSLHSSLWACGSVSPSLFVFPALSFANFVLSLSLIRPPSLLPSPSQALIPSSLSPLCSPGASLKLRTLFLGLEALRQGEKVPASQGPSPGRHIAISIRVFFRGTETSMTLPQASPALLILAQEGSSLMD